MPDRMESIRLLIVDDTLTRQDHIRNVLQDVDEIEVVGSATTGVEGILLYRELQPDVVSMDINMPLMDGLQTTRHLVSLHPEARVFFLTIHLMEEMLEPTREAGGIGYLLLPATKNELIEAIVDAANAVPEVLEREGGGEQSQPLPLTASQKANLEFAHRLSRALAPVCGGINQMKSIHDEIDRSVPRADDPPGYFQRMLAWAETELQQAVAELENPSNTGANGAPSLQVLDRPRPKLTRAHARREQRAQRLIDELRNLLSRIETVAESAQLLRDPAAQQEMLAVFEAQIESLRRDLLTLNDRVTSMTGSLVRRNLPRLNH